MNLPPPPAATAAHRKIYPRRVRGAWRARRWWLSGTLQAVLFCVPWITCHGRQAFLLDVPDRRLYLFDLVFWPQETYFLLIILLFLSLLLFASTALAGRLWCGYACPQTLLTEMFVVVERWFEGDRVASIKLDRVPWTPDKLRRKIGKYALWSGMGLWLGITVVGYFYPIRQLVVNITRLQVPPGALVPILFFAAAALFDFGWFREQFCHYVCPYARFQGSMFDPETLIVGYDETRGEPRGKLKTANKGDCVDCGLCVQVCPMGIDIRKGLQFECIACTSCMDACDQVMEKVGRPRGLIRYSSMSALEGKAQQVIRPRIVVYSLLLVALGSLFAVLLVARPLVEMDVLRQVSGNVFEVTADGRIMNVYTIKIMNRSLVSHTVRLSVTGLTGAELVTQQNPLRVPEDSAADVRVLVAHDKSGLPPISHLSFHLEDVSDPSMGRTVESTFAGPGL